MAIPKGGFFPGRIEQGRFGPIFPRTPLNGGFTIVARIIPGREPAFEQSARILQQAVADEPDCLAALRNHAFKWVLLSISDETYFLYQSVFDGDFDTYSENAAALFAAAGIDGLFENLEGLPADWKTNPGSFIEFVRDHHWPSFLEYCEYSYVSSAEIRRALAMSAGPDAPSPPSDLHDSP